MHNEPGNPWRRQIRSSVGVFPPTWTQGLRCLGCLRLFVPTELCVDLETASLIQSSTSLMINSFGACSEQSRRPPQAPQKSSSPNPLSWDHEAVLEEYIDGNEARFPLGRLFGTQERSVGGFESVRLLLDSEGFAPAIWGWRRIKHEDPESLRWKLTIAI